MECAEGKIEVSVDWGFPDEEENDPWVPFV